jgi:glyoxylase I family protein
MSVCIDHIVFWVEDPKASVAFYERVLGFAPVRLDAFERGEAPFPSVRVSEVSLIDFMSKRAAPMVEALSGAQGSAGSKVNHLCLAMSKSEWDTLRERLATEGTTPQAPMTGSFGARGAAPETFYFTDPDGNVIEARYYA